MRITITPTLASALLRQLDGRSLTEQHKAELGTLHTHLYEYLDKLITCECADKECASHKGSDCNVKARSMLKLFRVDMEDRTGTRFCTTCADDAMESGLFTSL